MGQFQVERHQSACNGPKTVQNPGTQKSTTNPKKLSTSSFDALVSSRPHYKLIASSVYVSISKHFASNPSLSGYLDALTQPERSTEPSCPPSSHASFESLEQQQQHQQEEEEKDQETRRTSLSPRSNCFNIIPDFAARLNAAVATTARHNLTPGLPSSCTSYTSTSIPHEKLFNELQWH